MALALPAGPARPHRRYRDDPASLRVQLCAALHDAAADLHKLYPETAPQPRALFDRFLGWLPPPDGPTGPD